MTTVDVESRTVRTRVFAVLPDYRQVRVETLDGFQYALTDKTHGIDLSLLREGQFVECIVTTSALPRVLEAHVIA